MELVGCTLVVRSVHYWVQVGKNPNIEGIKQE